MPYTTLNKLAENLEVMDDFYNKSFDTARDKAVGRSAFKNDVRNDYNEGAGIARTNLSVVRPIIQNNQLNSTNISKINRANENILAQSEFFWHVYFDKGDEVRKASYEFEDTVDNIEAIMEKNPNTSLLDIHMDELSNYLYKVVSEMDNKIMQVSEMEKKDKTVIEMGKISKPPAPKLPDHPATLEELQKFVEGLLELSSSPQLEKQRVRLNDINEILKAAIALQNAVKAVKNNPTESNKIEIQTKADDFQRAIYNAQQTAEQRIEQQNAGSYWSTTKHYFMGNKFKTTFASVIGEYKLPAGFLGCQALSSCKPASTNIAPSLSNSGSGSSSS